MVGNYKKEKHGLYVLGKENIENESENILRQFCPDCLVEPKEIDVEKLIEDMGLDLCYAKMSENSEILGAFVFNKGVIPTYTDDHFENKVYSEKTIIIDSTIAENDDPRLRFTYGHELGHYVTQYDIFHINENQLSLFNFSEEHDNAVICKRESIGFCSLFKERKSLETKEDWQEWQANYFSSTLLIPKCTLKIALKPYLDTYDVMDQTSLLNKLDVDEIMELVDKLSKIYNVSNEMMINRLKSLNYLN